MPSRQPQEAPPLQREAWHALSVESVAAALSSDLAAGLSRAEAAGRLAAAGPNLLPEAGPPGALRLLLHQFASILVYVLLAAALVSLFLGDILEAASILVIAVLNAALGFAQEYRAERALSALKALSAPSATVLREGAPARVAAADIVPGDVLLLEAGDVVAADARVVASSGLAAAEALLTGESVPVDKLPDAVAGDVQLPERSSMVYQGTLVSRGRGPAPAARPGGRQGVGGP